MAPINKDVLDALLKAGASAEAIVAYCKAVLDEDAALDGDSSAREVSRPRPIAVPTEVRAANAAWQSHLYIVARKQGEEFLTPAKIGFSNQVMARLASLQSGSAFEIAPVFAFRLPSRDFAQAIERQAHQCFQPRRAMGEWFDVDPYILVQAIDPMVDCALRAGARDDFHHWQLCDFAGCIAAQMLCDWKRPHWREP
jgi:hypothetical protein